MTKSFEDRFFEQLQDSVTEVRDDIKGLVLTVGKNAIATNKRLDKLDAKVFTPKKKSGIGNLFQDKQIIYAFLFALMVFLLILASVLHVKVPAF